MPEVRLPFYARLALMLLTVVLVLHLLRIGESVFVPLLFSLLLAFFLYPLVQWLEQKTGMSKGLACFVSVFGFMLLLGLFVYFLTFQIIAFTQDIPLLQQKVSEWLLHLQRWIAREYRVDSTQQMAYLGQVANSVLGSAANSVGTAFFSLSSFLFWTVLVFIYTYFILYHRRLLLQFITRLFPKEHRLQVRHAVLETRVVTNAYVVGLLIEFVVISIANCIAFFVLGIHYAILLALLAAVLNVIPYFGIIAGIIITVVVTLAHHDPTTAIWAAALLFVLHIIDANILVPRVVGSKVKMNALITLVAVLIGGAIWGIAGLFLAIPLSAMLKIVFEHIPAMQPWALLMGTEKRETGDD